MKKNKIGKCEYCKQYWPPVESTNGLSLSLKELFVDDDVKIVPTLKNLSEKNSYEQTIMDILGEIYSLYYNYKDSPLKKIGKVDYFRIIRIKIILENEMRRYILPIKQVNEDIYESIDIFCDYLEKIVYNNSGVRHSFFNYIEKYMPRSEFNEFLLLETIRNEVVDDEVAMMIPGLQHSMKQVLAANFWDECGNGEIDGFHTTWLRRLVKALEPEIDILKYRVGKKPWFASITSNSLNSFLTTFGGTYSSYGHFLVTEGWVAPHFKKIISGMKRVGIDSEDALIYFTAHKDLDPYHTADMLEGIKKMKPMLSKTDMKEIILGAEQAIVAGTLMYDKFEEYFNKGKN